MAFGKPSGDLRFDGRAAPIVTDGQPANGSQPGAPVALRLGSGLID